MSEHDARLLALDAEERLDLAAAADAWRAAAEHAAELPARVGALCNAVRNLRAMGNLDAARELALRALTGAVQHKNDAARGRALEALARVRLAEGEEEAALHLWGEARRVWERVGEAGDRARAAAGAAEVHLHRGALDEARALAAPIRDHVAALEDPAEQGRALAVSAVLRTLDEDDGGGQLEAHHVSQLLAAPRFVPEAAEVATLYGVALLHGGRAASAAGQLHRAAGFFDRLGNHPALAVVAMELARVMESQANAPGADQLLDVAIDALSRTGDRRRLLAARRRSTELAVALHAPTLARDRALAATALVRELEGLEAALRELQRVLRAVAPLDPEAAGGLADAIIAGWGDHRPDRWTTDEVIRLAEGLVIAQRPAVAEELLVDRALWEKRGGSDRDAARVWAEAGFVARDRGDAGAAAGHFEKAIRIAHALGLPELAGWGEVLRGLLGR